MKTLVISDLHEPMTHPGALDFIDSVAQQEQPDRVVFIGDIVDHHAVSAWVQHPKALGPMDEYELALEQVQKWYTIYPDAVVTIGNHDARPVRMAEKIGVPGAYLKDYAQVWNTPRWTWVENVIIDNVYYTHGTGRGGMYPAPNLAKKMCMSAVMGHTHRNGGIKWYANPVMRWFGMDTGALIDDRLYSFAYAKEQTDKSILGCGLVDSENVMNTRFIAMPCGHGEKFARSNYKINPLLEGRLA